MRRAAIVVDLGFGDAGKGSVVDFLARRLEAHAVVRFNGGAQAGHNVALDDGRHHTFSQFGAGTFVPGVRTFLSRHFVLHPTALLVEARHLEGKGVSDPLARLSVSERALVTTPFHQAAGRIRELARGRARHGSCGVGVGETVGDALSRPDEAVLARDLRSPRALVAKLERIRERKRGELDAALAGLEGEPLAVAESRCLEDPDVAVRWIEAVAEGSRCVAGDEELGALLERPGSVVFEGAHGVLLDEWRGFHPFTTWSTCTFENALALLAEHGYAGEVSRLGVLRTYAVRHGPGPFPTESSELALAEPHNPSGTWQGAFRIGWPDLVLARYALAVAGGVDGLAVTHLDALERVEEWRACVAYRMTPAEERFLESSGRAIRLGPPRDLEHQEALGRVLSAVSPEYVPIPLARDGRERAESYLGWLESSLGVPVRLTSSGPTAKDKLWRGLP